MGRLARLLTCAYVLVRETQYIEHRARGGKELRRAGQCTRLLAAYAALSAITSFMVGLSLGLCALASAAAGGEAVALALAAAGFALTSMCFVLALLSTSMGSWTLQEYRVLEPLRLLPLSEWEVSLAVLAHSAFYALPAILLPLAMVAVARQACNPLAAAHLLLGPYSAVLLVAGLSYRLASVATSYGKASGRTLRVRLYRAASVVAFTSSFLLLQLANALAEALASLARGLLGVASVAWAVYPLTVLEGVYLSYADPPASAAVLAVELAYAALFAVFYAHSFIWFYTGAAGRAMPAYRSRVPPLTAPRLWGGPRLAVAVRDAKLALRDPRVASVALCPLYACAATLASLALPRGLKPEALLPFSSLALAVVTPLTAVQLAAGEGGGLWLSLHLLGRRGLLQGKVLLATLLCTACSAVVAVALAIACGDAALLTAAATVTLTSYASSCALARVTASKLTPHPRASLRFSAVDVMLMTGLSLAISAPPLIALGLSALSPHKLLWLAASLALAAAEAGACHVLWRGISEGAA